MVNKERRARWPLAPQRNGQARHDAHLGAESAAVPWATMAAYATTLALVAMLVDGGDRPFPYFLGQRVDRDLRLRETIRLDNETKTRQQRDEAAAKTPISFRRNDDRLRNLQRQFGDLLTQAAEKGELERIDARMRAEWQLTPERFAALRDVAPAVERVGPALEALSAVFAATVERGVLDPNSLPPDVRQSIETAENLEIVAPSGAPTYERERELRIAEWTSAQGWLAKRLAGAFRNSGPAIFGMLAPKLAPTLEYDPERTSANRETSWNAVEPVVDAVNRGTLVVEANRTIDEEALRLLREEHRLLRQQLSWRARPERLLATAALTAGVFAAVWWLLRLRLPKAEPGRLAAAVLASMLAAATFAKLLRVAPYQAEIVPVVVISLIWAVAFDRLSAAVVAAALSLLVALMAPEPMPVLLILLSGTMVGVLSMTAVRTRTKLIRVGASCALGFGLAAFAAGAIDHQTWTIVLRDALWRAGCGMLACVFLGAFLPIVEQTFGVVTAISLKELADSNHPLLREMARKAPGTFNHSLTVSMFAEAAAKSIGADSEVVRVGALFHDVGKTHKAQYFVENTSLEERSRHADLAPAMSTLIIIGHIRDGMELGKQHHLPQPLLDMIEQHHGTTRVDYFYREAERLTRLNPQPDEEVVETAFRYPGPKPQTKEIAVLMLADCVESASRTLVEPTPARIEKLIDELAMARLLDGQFDESGLTLQELRAVKTSLAKSVSSHYHSRVKYPAAV